MNTKKEKTWVQCLSCGHMHMVERKVPISISVVKVECPKCEWEKGLNCGYNEMDVMELKDPYLDERYFIY